jgi:hypothetical protein
MNIKTKEKLGHDELAIGERVELIRCVESIRGRILAPEGCTGTIIELGNTPMGLSQWVEIRLDDVSGKHPQVVCVFPQDCRKI